MMSQRGSVFTLLNHCANLCLTLHLVRSRLCILIFPAYFRCNKDSLLGEYILNVQTDKICHTNILIEPQL